MFTQALLRVARATTVAVVMVAAVGPPISAAASEVTLHLAQIRWEKEKLRRKLAEAQQSGRIYRAARSRSPDRELCLT